MKYNLFLFDADDTLFDFKACERGAFARALSHHGHTDSIDELYATYGIESKALWREVELGTITKDFLKAERFRRTFVKHGVSLAPDAVGTTYLDILPETAVLIEHANELCERLSAVGQIGIITNGFEIVQTRRLQGSTLAPHVSFMVVSEQCGFTKPDVRFFEHTARLVKDFEKSRTLVIGDRLEADIAGAHAFGVDSCWFNPTGERPPAGSPRPTYEVRSLREVEKILS